ncbi:Ig-like domain-containing protein [Flavobacterium hauense]
MKKILLFALALTFSAAKAQNCQSTDPGTTAGSTSCISFMYDGSLIEYTTVRAADGNVWLQQNLGSTQVATSSSDPDSYGGYFQWGRWQDGHEKNNSLVGTTASPNNPTGVGTANAYFIPTWWNVAATGDSWAAATPNDVTETNGCDPCKALGNGWRLPTEAEWSTIITTEGITNVSTGYDSNLRLAVAGYRGSTGGFTFVGSRAYYWSSTPSTSTTNYSKYLYYSNAAMNPSAGGLRGQAASVRCIKGQSATPPAVPVSVAITTPGGAPAVITANGGILTLLSAITPANATQSVTWSIIEGSELATINGNGVVTALANGTITVQAASTETPTVLSTITVTITNQYVVPTSVEVTTQNNADAAISTNAGTLQLTAAVLPAAADQSVTWNITSGNGLASVDANGLVTAIANGTITVQAINNADTTLTDSIDITITGQYVAPTSLELTVANNDSPFIITQNGTLLLQAAILPAEANQSVTWSVISGELFASVNEGGLVTAIADGVVTIQAVSNDDASILDTISITITNQNPESAAPYCEVSTEYGVEPISLVQFAGIDNPTSPEINSTPSYQNFTTKKGSVIKGETYTLTVEGNTAGLFSHDIRVFIDWNIDNAFDMATEYYATTIENTTGTDGVQATLEITVPQTAVTGTTRIRITKDQWNIYEEGEFDGCTDAYYGQVEDYSLEVTEPVTGIDDLNKTAYTVYPNPTNGLVTVQADAEVLSAEVYNLTGQLIATANGKQLNLSQAAAGIYIMKIRFEGGNTATQKIIKRD